MVVLPGSVLWNALQEEDVPFPPEVREIHLDFPCDGLATITYVCNLTSDVMESFGRAMVKVGGNL